MNTQDGDDNGSNGGILARFGKYSWSLILLGLIGGPISTFFMMRETMTVGLNAAEIRITALDAQNKEMKETIGQLMKDVVPRQEHNSVEEKQGEIERMRDARIDRLENEVYGRKTIGNK